MSLPDIDGVSLYAQVRERLIERIAWRVEAGPAHRHEFEIAAEFGVSQGTARKAIGGLASKGSVVRREGRGHVRGRAHACAHVLFRLQLIDETGVADLGQPGRLG